MRKKFCSCAILWLTILASSEQFCLADSGEIQAAKTRVNDFAAKNGKNSAEYARQLLSLAAAYQRAGQRENALKSYKESLAVVQNLPESKSLLPQTMLLFAGILSIERKNPEIPQTAGRKEKDALLAKEKQAHLRDLERAEEIIAESITILDRDKTIKRSKYLAYFQYIQLLRLQKKEKEAELVQDKLDKLLAESEKSKNLNDADIYVLAGTLEQVSVFYTGYFSSNTIPEESFKKTSAENYKRGEGLRKRALALLDRLAAENPRRLEAHKIMDSFYRFYGKSKGAK